MTPGQASGTNRDIRDKSGHASVPETGTNTQGHGGHLCPHVPFVPGLMSPFVAKIGDALFIGKPLRSWVAVRELPYTRKDGEV